jgi:hypothetical protein
LVIAGFALVASGSAGSRYAPQRLPLEDFELMG